jgi:outer membrane protein
MKEYTSQRSWNKIQKLSLKKRKTTRSRNQTLQTRCFNFQSQAQANRSRVGSEKKAELQKRTTVELCPTSFVTTTATKRNWNGHFGKWRKKFIKAYGKEKDTLISMELEMLLLFCMLRKIWYHKDIVKALNDKYKAAAKTEDKAEDKTELKQRENNFFHFYNHINAFILLLEWRLCFFTSCIPGVGFIFWADTIVDYKKLLLPCFNSLLI